MSSYPPPASGAAPADDGDWADFDMSMVQTGGNCGTVVYDDAFVNRFFDPDPSIPIPAHVSAPGQDVQSMGMQSSAQSPMVADKDTMENLVASLPLEVLANDAGELNVIGVVACNQPGWGKPGCLIGSVECQGGNGAAGSNRYCYYCKSCGTKWTQLRPESIGPDGNPHIMSTTRAVLPSDPVRSNGYKHAKCGLKRKNRVQPGEPYCSCNEEKRQKKKKGEEEKEDGGRDGGLPPLDLSDLGGGLRSVPVSSTTMPADAQATMPTLAAAPPPSVVMATTVLSAPGRTNPVKSVEALGTRVPMRGGGTDVHKLTAIVIANASSAVARALEVMPRALATSSAPEQAEAVTRPPATEQAEAAQPARPSGPPKKPSVRARGIGKPVDYGRMLMQKHPRELDEPMKHKPRFRSQQMAAPDAPSLTVISPLRAKAEESADDPADEPAENAPDDKGAADEEAAADTMPKAWLGWPGVVRAVEPPKPPRAKMVSEKQKKSQELEAVKSTEKNLASFLQRPLSASPKPIAVPEPSAAAAAQKPTPLGKSISPPPNPPACTKKVVCSMCTSVVLDDDDGEVVNLAVGCDRKGCDIWVCSVCAGYPSDAVATRKLKSASAKWFCCRHERKKKNCLSQCTRCKTMLKDRDGDVVKRAVGCDECHEQFCLSCANVTAAKLDTLDEWYCSKHDYRTFCGACGRMIEDRFGENLHDSCGCTTCNTWYCIDCTNFKTVEDAEASEEWACCQCSA